MHVSEMTISLLNYYALMVHSIIILSYEADKLERIPSFDIERYAS